MQCYAAKKGNRCTAEFHTIGSPGRQLVIGGKAAAAVLGKEIPLTVVQSGGKNVGVSIESPQHLLRALRIIKRQRSSGIRSQRLRQSLKLAHDGGPETRTLVKRETNRGETQREKTRAHDEYSQLVLDGLTAQ